MEALVASELRYRRLFESARDGILILDAETGVVVDVNPFLIERSGCSHETFLGKRVWELEFFRSIVASQSHFLELQQKGCVRHENMTLETHDGRRIEVEFISNVYQAGRRRMMQCNIRDNTAHRRTTEALRASEEKFQSLFDNTHDAIMILEPPSWKFTSGNPSAVRMFGVKNEEDFISHRPWELSPDHQPDGRPSVEKAREMIETAVREGSHFFEWTHRRVGGGEFPVNVLLTRMELGGKVMLHATVRDITERKQAEEALKLFRALVDQSSDAIEVIDPETGRFLDVNERSCLDLAYHREEFLALRVFDIDPTVNPSTFTKIVEELRKSGVLRWQGIHHRKDHSTFPVEVNLKYVQLDRGYIVAAVRDVTERKRMEEVQARLAAAVEQSAETIIITDANATILYVNPAFERTTGYTREEAIGQNPRILKSGKQDAAFFRRMWAALTAGEVWRCRMTNKRKDGTLYEEDSTVSSVRNTAGQIVNYVAVQHDVTRETQLEAQLRQAQKMESIGRLAGGVAHDFNNLLMVIMGYSDMALKALPTKDPLRKHIEEVLAAGARAVTLTRQLLAFGRKQLLEPRVLDLNDLATNLSKMLRLLIGENIRLTTTFASDLGRVRADPGQIEQVIINLAINARDAMPEGGTLTLETTNVKWDGSDAVPSAGMTPGPYVRLSITDTGTGMSDEVKAHLFEPFFTTKEQGKGTGLGLSTVYGIVKQSGGHIMAYSEVGHGTTFKIYLPRIEEAAEVAHLAGATVELPRGTETILLVEDEEQVRNLARVLLEECGYRVLVADNGPDAIQLAEQHEGKIQMLLTDVIMPEMNGRALAPLLTTLNPDLKVLYMSGYTDTTMLRQDLMAPGSAFLQKPFSLNVLAHKVREVLDARNQVVEAADC